MNKFFIKNNFQKRTKLHGVSYEDLLTDNVLKDVCRRITGEDNYEAVFDNVGTNYGRLAILENGEEVHYISFSEDKINGRNSAFQSFPTALMMFLQDERQNKNIHFYFLTDGVDIEKIKTEYFLFMYRLIKTTRTNFLNEDVIPLTIHPFNTVSDIINQRDVNRRNKSNNYSSYVTIDENDTIQLFGKTYGANKYETALLCIAINKITDKSIELYQFKEGNLKKLPKTALKLLNTLKVKLITTDRVLEKNEFINNNSLRSPNYTLNLLEKLGMKKCFICDCDVPQIIQGAHIWPVSSIKNLNGLSEDEKIEYAIDKDNGIWLCSNHHKLFDINLLYISEDGSLRHKSNIHELHKKYLYATVVNKKIPQKIMTNKFIFYLQERNKALTSSEFVTYE